MSTNDGKSDLERSFEALSLELEPVEPPAPAPAESVQSMEAPEPETQADLNTKLELSLDEDQADLAAPDVQAMEPAEPISSAADVGKPSAEPAELEAPPPVDASIDQSGELAAEQPPGPAPVTEPASKPSLAPAPVVPPSLRRRLKGLITELGERMFGDAVGIAVSASVVTACAALMLWSVFVRLDILDEVVALEMQELDLSASHGQLTLELSKINQDAVRSEIEEQNARIFNGFPAVANWIERLSERAEGMNMNVRYRVGDPTMAPVADVLEVPVVIEFEVASEDDGGLFRRGMALVESLLDDHWHLDIASTQAAGDGKGLRSLELEARLWVFDTEEFLAPQLLANSSEGSELEMTPDAEFIQ